MLKRRYISTIGTLALIFDTKTLRFDTKTFDIVAFIVVT